MFADPKTELELIVDSASLNSVLAMLAEMCHAKADHVAYTWQDKGLAHSWSQDAKVLERALTKLQN